MSFDVTLIIYYYRGETKYAKLKKLSKINC